MVECLVETGMRLARERSQWARRRRSEAFGAGYALLVATWILILASGVAGTASLFAAVACIFGSTVAFGYGLGFALHLQRTRRLREADPVGYGLRAIGGPGTIPVSSYWADLHAGEEAASYAKVVNSWVLSQLEEEVERELHDALAPDFHGSARELIAVCRSLA